VLKAKKKKALLEIVPTKSCVGIGPFGATRLIDSTESC
jgi:hypothetical protein